MPWKKVTRLLASTTYCWNGTGNVLQIRSKDTWVVREFKHYFNIGGRPIHWFLALGTFEKYTFGKETGQVRAKLLEHSPGRISEHSQCTLLALLSYWQTGWPSSITQSEGHILTLFWSWIRQAQNWFLPYHLIHTFLKNWFKFSCC